MFQTLNSQPLPPSRVHGSGRPDWFDPVVARAMAKRADDRFPTALAFADELRRQVGHVEPVREAPLPLGPVQSPAASPGHAFADTVPSGAGSSPGSNWDPETLSQFEHELAHAIGPMARVLVKRAAKSSVDLEGLRNTLASQIEQADERDNFLRRTRSRVGGGTGTHSTGGAGTRPAGGATPTPRPATRLDTLFGEHVVREAQAELTRYVGPIAHVLVTRAAEKAKSRDEFFALLVEHVDAEADRERLLQALLKASRRI
jgi:serine/threonine-protein kinase